MERVAKPPLVLIVDDVPGNLQVLGSSLKSLDCRIAFAMAGEQALAMVDQLRPDLILLDILMPDIDGLEVCRRLKADPATAEIPVVFLTAKDDGADVVAGLRAGAVDYVKKPFNTDELLSRVSTHLELKRIRDEQRELISSLQRALSEVRRLSGLLPICSYCKQIRDDEGYWRKVESYIAAHTGAKFSHSICPSCLDERYPDDGGDDAD